MTTGVVVLGSGAGSLAPAVGAVLVARGLDVAVVAAPDDPTLAAIEVAGCRQVVGVSTTPWPVAPGPHGRVRDVLDQATTPYYAVESWHLLPGFVRERSEAVRAGADRAGGVHVLVTAPGQGTGAAGVPAEPARSVFLRESAQAICDAAGVSQRSIGWTGGAARPTAATVLGTLADAHGRRRVAWCPLDPAVRAEPEVRAAAAAARVELRVLRPAAGSHERRLAEVVTTVLEHERGVRP